MENSKDYYKTERIELIEYLESLDISHDFCLGNCLKYLTRFKRKNLTISAQLEDLKKAQWYLNRLISYYQQEENQ